MRIVSACLAVLVLAGCSGPATPGVPRLSGGGGGGPQRKAALHAAAECIRQHGISGYQDPVLTADGHVYTDSRSYRDADDGAIQAVEAACKALLDAAQFQPTEQAPAPPALVQAGVRSRQCLREHGLVNLTDPTATSEFTPGHGFGINPDQMPGDKTDPVVQRALDACRPILDEEGRLSSLGSLGDA
ncbi:hypothetical protein ACFPIJ_06365 [Dactylosporangium cerinum]|uniref:Lipoprotein n=1 Tax=Dactylosporangium cerinum TaxID=1434730 RepID=A0ABV9VPV4_9ACTN